MKFEDFKYERPDLEDFKNRTNVSLSQLANGKTLEEELVAIKEVFKLHDEIETLFNLVSIRNSVDTTDKFYEAEQEYFNEIAPHLQQ